MDHSREQSANQQDMYCIYMYVLFIQDQRDRKPGIWRCISFLNYTLAEYSMRGVMAVQTVPSNQLSKLCLFEILPHVMRKSWTQFVPYNRRYFLGCNWVFDDSRLGLCWPLFVARISKVNNRNWFVPINNENRTLHSLISCRKVF